MHSAYVHDLTQPERKESEKHSLTPHVHMLTTITKFSC